jgi:hypothetical protein
VEDFGGGNGHYKTPAHPKVLLSSHHFSKETKTMSPFLPEQRDSSLLVFTAGKPRELAGAQLN